MSKTPEATPEQPQGETVPKAQFDALAAEVAELKAAAAKPEENPADDGPTVEEQLAANNKRVTDLYKLASSAGLDDATDTAEKWAEQGLSVVEAKAALADRMLAANKLTDDGGNPAPDPDAAYKAEYRAQKAHYEKEGVTEEDYVASAKITAAQPSF